MPVRPVASIETIELFTGRNIMAHTLQHARFSHSSVIHDDKLFVISGVDDHNRQCAPCCPPCVTRSVQADPFRRSVRSGERLSERCS